MSYRPQKSEVNFTLFTLCVEVLLGLTTLGLLHILLLGLYVYWDLLHYMVKKYLPRGCREVAVLLGPASNRSSSRIIVLNVAPTVVDETGLRGATEPMATLGMTTLAPKQLYLSIRLILHVPPSLRVPTAESPVWFI